MGPLLLVGISKACGSGKKPKMHQMALWLGSVGMLAPRRPQGSGFQGVTEGSLGVSTLSFSLPACTIPIFLRSPLSDFFPVTLFTPSSLHTCFFLPPPFLLVPLSLPSAPYLFPSPLPFPCSPPLPPPSLFIRPTLPLSFSLLHLLSYPLPCPLTCVFLCLLAPPLISPFVSSSLSLAFLSASSLFSSCCVFHLGYRLSLPHPGRVGDPVQSHLSIPGVTGSPTLELPLGGKHFFP